MLGSARKKAGRYSDVCAYIEDNAVLVQRDTRDCGFVPSPVRILFVPQQCKAWSLTKITIDAAVSGLNGITAQTRNDGGSHAREKAAAFRRV